MALDAIKHFVAVSPTLATAGQPSEAQLREVAQAGFEVVINLGLLDPRYCLADEAGCVRALGLDYAHLPVDFGAPAAADLQRFLDVMAACDGRRVFVHCAANYRVACFVALYGQARLGWSRAAADAHVARVWQPDAVWSAFLERARMERGLGD
ncbi:protein tyrosine phosphatase (PTP) superfamily phosphohydrolase (DUF442 family) [Plasticicumulans lactativorans]|uniref:Protein tyrosine phosphatase (PTP) superfamily phosphohydrolase (DUF442 family) n=1 Tax=Plasticicumulans lactativorans TaxID=1133106 RepID=A0A4R2L2B0_9GAMM|nr:protein tyrosine phosphatase family protein [Plasticicumulans lactativorans]TCO80604.1 protein tyrosine phosphatase (PTP) superfamily phosphohydrolase (DUF442 family) [Plasticicumulans lactativorans]